MGRYWALHRFFLTLIITVAVALVASCLFVYPSIVRQADAYNSQSVYKNTEIDFIAPEPSFEQVDELPGANGIDKVFPYFLTNTQVNVNGASRSTTVLLSDQFQNVDLTMYNSARLIKKSNKEYDNAVLVDWQFCHDTSAGIGDTVSMTIGGVDREYRIYAIYETNSIYDNGAILAEISDDEKKAIVQQSGNSGYSGMYISASDYNTCQSFLASEYRPLGRLKDRDSFSDSDKYQVHYDAIMSSGYANEITDFRVRENDSAESGGKVVIWIGTLLTAILMLGFNIVMSGRGCERAYFSYQCIPKGEDVKSYYMVSFVFETVLSIVFYVIFLVLRIRMSETYIPGSAIGFRSIMVPIAIIVAEIISYCMNRLVVLSIERKAERE